MESVLNEIVAAFKIFNKMAANEIKIKIRNNKIKFISANFFPRSCYFQPILELLGLFSQKL